MKRITDPDFKYTPAVATNIRETFARARREQQRATPPTCHERLPGESLDRRSSSDVWTVGD